MPKVVKFAAESLSLKRQAAAVVLVIITLMNTIPGYQDLAQSLLPLAAALGAVGLTHASLVGTISAAKLSGLAALMSIVLFAAKLYPPLQPYVPLLEAIAALLSAGGLTLLVPTVRQLRLR